MQLKLINNNDKFIKDNYKYYNISDNLFKRYSSKQRYNIV